MTRHSLLLVVGCVLAIACNEYDLVEDGDGQAGIGEGGAPDITVDPTQVTFASYEVGVSAEQTEVVVVTNDGDADLHIQDLYLADSTAPFTVGSISSVLIQPGSTAQFTVTFEAQTSGSATGTVLIDSDDPDEPTVEVQLTGDGIAPVIEVTPETYDFGTLYVGCDSRLPVTISNVGTADLIVSSLEYNTASVDDILLDDSASTNGALPWTLAPSESVEVYVDYAPLDAYSDIAYLMIASNDPWVPTTMATQNGGGAFFGDNLDVFEQPVKGATDIIFAVDKSGSMDDDILSVQSNFGTFVNTLAGLDADYQVAAVVADDGCIAGGDPWIDNTFSASEAEETITAMINTGMTGSNTERAFMLLESCASESASGGCNDGLIREDATLNLVGVSDEPEQSVNNYAYYVALFQSLKDNPDDMIMHAIGGDYPTGCGSASAYTGYYEATVATGGLFLSICATDWGAHLEELAEGTVSDLSSFALTETPVPDTIVVRVDGQTITSGWTYDETTNTVNFDEAPDGGSTIEVEYALPGDCEG
jgi:Abnormal spindle-like microcephaly-assoc'd, ASPM-SPD-2-Hydin